jgi:hypothetical protein
VSDLLAGVLLLLAVLLSPALRAAPTAQEVGIVVMHGKGGSPGRFVNVLAEALEKEGFLVANLEMPWSKKRHYDVELDVPSASSPARWMHCAPGGRKSSSFPAIARAASLPCSTAGGTRSMASWPSSPAGRSTPRLTSTPLGNHVATARQMVADGRGQEKPSSPITRARAAPTR